ncbi:MAG TPA: CpsB/CapC family capsule biosynthesis tyrosine phosphatase, partial [Blastocatellia bacterium]|nr:CpsB/CapC family capsule biosynthesis tyrosine phosphatase [Blastocatellia bacterium]
MVDIHCHVLPETDDGAISLEESVAMCRAAAADGIKTI